MIGGLLDPAVVRDPDRQESNLLIEPDDNETRQKALFVQFHNERMRALPFPVQHTHRKDASTAGGVEREAAEREACPRGLQHRQQARQSRLQPCRLQVDIMLSFAN